MRSTIFSLLLVALTACGGTAPLYFEPYYGLQIDGCFSGHYVVARGGDRNYDLDGSGTLMLEAGAAAGFPGQEINSRTMLSVGGAPSSGLTVEACGEVAGSGFWQGQALLCEEIPLVDGAEKDQ